MKLLVMHLLFSFEKTCWTKYSKLTYRNAEASTVANGCKPFTTNLVTAR